MTKKIDQSDVDWKRNFLKLTKMLEKRLSISKLREYIEKDKLFMSLTLPLLLKEYEDLSQLFKKVTEEEIQELKRVKLMKNLEIFFANFLKKVETIDSKIHEDVTNTLVRYGEGNITTLSELKGKIVSILSDHEDLVREFLENLEEPIDATDHLRRHKIVLEKAYKHMKKRCVYRPQPCGTMRRKS